MVLTGAQAASADPVFCNTKPAFTSANPGLPVENFETARVATGGVVTFPNPLNSVTNNAVFSSGEILAGLSFGNANSANLNALGGGTLTGASKIVRTSTLGSSIDLDFTSEVTSLAADLYAAGSPGAPVASSFRITLFGPSGQLGQGFIDSSGIAAGLLGV